MYPQALPETDFIALQYENFCEYLRHQKIHLINVTQQLLLTILHNHESPKRYMGSLFYIWFSTVLRIMLCHTIQCMDFLSIIHWLKRDKNLNRKVLILALSPRYKGLRTTHFHIYWRSACIWLLEMKIWEVTLEIAPYLTIPFLAASEKLRTSAKSLSSGPVGELIMRPAGRLHGFTATSVYRELSACQRQNKIKNKTET